MYIPEEPGPESCCLARKTETAPNSKLETKNSNLIHHGNFPIN
jgi:hypothetical protein